MSGAFGRSPGLGDGALGLGIDAARSHPCELERYITFPSLCFLDWEMGVTISALPARTDEKIALI